MHPVGSFRALLRLQMLKSKCLCSGRLQNYWLPKCRQLSPPLQALLGSENVWCDSRTEEGSQKFVLWAGCVLERRCSPLPFSTPVCTSEDKLSAIQPRGWISLKTGLGDLTCLQPKHASCRVYLSECCPTRVLKGSKGGNPHSCQKTLTPHLTVQTSQLRYKLRSVLTNPAGHGTCATKLSTPLLVQGIGLGGSGPLLLKTPGGSAAVGLGSTLHRA